MLFAPKAGEETAPSSRPRPEKAQTTSKQGRRSSEFIKQRGSELKDTATSWVDKGKDAVGRRKERPRRPVMPANRPIATQ